MKWLIAAAFVAGLAFCVVLAYACCVVASDYDDAMEMPNDHQF